MKLRTLNLAAIAALATMAFVGASTASADTACKVAVDPCPEASRYALPLHIEAFTKVAGPFTILAGSNIEERCHSKWLGELTTNDGAHTQLLGVLTEFSLSQCEGICGEFKTENLPYSIEASGLNDAEGKQIVHLKPHAEGGVLSFVGEKCFGFLKCLYIVNGFTSMSLDFVGGATAHLTALEIPLTGPKGSFCPETGALDASYDLLLPKPLFLSALP